jgi:hypothetical protein
MSETIVMILMVVGHSAAHGKRQEIILQFDDLDFANENLTKAFKAMYERTGWKPPLPFGAKETCLQDVERVQLDLVNPSNIHSYFSDLEQLHPFAIRYLISGF